MTLYEGMFLLDNQVVRADWAKAKGLVSDAVTKHGGTVATARRWDERKLCYPIAGKKRATYVLSYFELESAGIAGLRRDLELSESVLRYLMLRVEAIPEGEAEKSEAENAEGFSFPVPPEDDEPEATPEPRPAKGAEKESAAKDADEDDSDGEGEPVMAGADDGSDDDRKQEEEA